jgi:spore germination protein GerM
MADRKKKKKTASLGCLFWIAFILLIIVLFFFNKKNIADLLDKTGASAFFSGKGVTAEQTADGKTTIVAPINTTDTPDLVANETGDGSKEPESAPQKTDKPAKDEKSVSQTSPKTAEKPKETSPVTVAPKPAKKPAEPTTKPTPKPAAEKSVPTRKATLFFVVIDADGSVVRKEVTREIPQTDSPLTETLQALLKGPTPAESGKGYRSLIPQGSRLLSANVKNGVATLNLSEEFQFNQYGIEGYLGQLSEIVFTATAFSTVKSVQFLIDGQRREYLGAEGVWIGTPLSRDKFQ